MNDGYKGITNITTIFSIPNMSLSGIDIVQGTSIHSVKRQDTACDIPRNNHPSLSI